MVWVVFISEIFNWWVKKMRRRGSGVMVRRAAEKYIDDGCAVFPLSKNSKVPSEKV